MQNAALETAIALVACLLVLAQAGRHREVLEMVERHARSIDKRSQPAVAALRAMALVALGRERDARKALRGARDGTHPLVHHARAVLSVVRPAEALAELALAAKAGYREWHWVAVDPSLAPLHSEPAFAKLVADAARC